MCYRRYSMIKRKTDMKQTKLILDINAHISNIECNISNEGNAIISFDNIIGKTITAVKFNAKGYNSFGDIVPVNGNEKFFLIIQDINIEMNSHSGNLKATMPNSDIKKLELEECQICYSDGTVSTYEGKEILRQHHTMRNDCHRQQVSKDRLGYRQHRI